VYAILGNSARDPFGNDSICKSESKSSVFFVDFSTSSGYGQVLCYCIGIGGKVSRWRHLSIAVKWSIVGALVGGIAWSFVILLGANNGDELYGKLLDINHTNTAGDGYDLGNDCIWNNPVECDVTQCLAGIVCFGVGIGKAVKGVVL
jgi:hypothetical protein